MYFTVSLAGLPAFLIVMAAVGYLRGTQDTRTPLYVAMGTVVLNLVLEVVAIYVLGFGVGASALGTVIAKWVGALVLGGLVIRDVRRRGLPLRPHLAGIGRVGSAGWPLFVRTAALRLSFVASTAVAGRMSRDDLAGYAIAFQIWVTLAYVVDGLEVAGQVLVGHSLGTGDAAWLAPRRSTDPVVGARARGRDRRPAVGGASAARRHLHDRSHGSRRGGRVAGVGRARCNRSTR